MVHCVLMAVLIFLPQSPSTAKEMGGPPIDSQASSPSITQTFNFQQEAEITEHKSRWLNQAFGPQTWSGWAVIPLYIWAALLARKSLKTLVQQTNATKVAADAALRQAKHLIASERAWVMVELSLNSSLPVAQSEDSTMATVQLALSSSGSTPAWVYEQYLYLWVTPAVIRSSEKYSAPDFPYTGPGSTGMLGHVSFEIIPLSEGQLPVISESWITCKGIATYQNAMTVYIFGVVRYRDAFNSLCETRFGYSIKGKQLQRIPNEAFNRHT